MESTHAEGHHIAAEDVVLLSPKTTPRRTRVGRRKSKLPPLPLPDDDRPAPGFCRLDSTNVSNSSTALSSGRPRQSMSSVAQKIAADYRATQANKENVKENAKERPTSPLQLGQQPIGSGHPADSTIPSIANIGVLVEAIGVTATAKDVNERPTPDLIPRFRQSRLDSLDDAREEAMRVMLQHGTTDENERIKCDRPGCGMTLPNLKALTYHLDIHNMDDQGFDCTKCGGHYANRIELCMHLCSLRRHGVSISRPTSPISVKSVRRVFGSLCCLNNTKKEDTSKV